MRKLALSIVLVGILALANAGTASAAKGGTDRPWRCTGTGTWEFTPDLATIHFSQVMNCTHLGRSTTEGTAFASPSGGGATYEIVAANGDRLAGTNVSTLTSGSETEFTLDQTDTYHGGTGRFADAHGSAVGHLTAVIIEPGGLVWYVTFTTEGTISY